MDLEKLYSIFYTSLKATTISLKENQQKSYFNANSQFRKYIHFQKNLESLL